MGSSWRARTDDAREMLERTLVARVSSLSASESDAVEAVVELEEVEVEVEMREGCGSEVGAGSRLLRKSRSLPARVALGFVGGGDRTGVSTNSTRESECAWERDGIFEWCVVACLAWQAREAPRRAWECGVVDERNRVASESGM